MGGLEKHLVERKNPLLHVGLKKTYLNLPVSGVTLPLQSTALLTLAKWGRAGKAFGWEVSIIAWRVKEDLLIFASPWCYSYPPVYPSVNTGQMGAAGKAFGWEVSIIAWRLKEDLLIFASPWCYSSPPVYPSVNTGRMGAGWKSVLLKGVHYCMKG